MLRKNNLLTVVLFLFTVLLFSEDLEYITIRRTMLYDRESTNFIASKDALFEIDADIKVKINKRIYIRKTVEDESAFITANFEYDSKQYYINCADLIPLNTVDTFAPSFISEPNSRNRKTWVPSYYTEVLQSMDRNTILTLDKFWREFDPYMYIPLGEPYGEEWYERFIIMFPCTEFMISNAALSLGEYVEFAIKNIEKIENGYTVTVKSGREERDWKSNKLDDFNWDIVEGKEIFDMIFQVDGDYMEVYLDDMEHKLTTFALVDQIFLQELKTLVEENHADLTNIVWPRRNDGSMDYPPPLDMTNYKATHRATDNLRLLDSASTTAEWVTTIAKGTEVQVIETGSEAVVDGKNISWVKVISSTGYSGWCSSEFLWDINKPAEQIENSGSIINNNKEQERQRQETSGMPAWIWIAVIGVVVAASGAAVLIVKRKKRS